MVMSAPMVNGGLLGSRVWMGGISPCWAGHASERPVDMAALQVCLLAATLTVGDCDGVGVSV